jgi:hypothetical protein
VKDRVLIFSARERGGRHAAKIDAVKIFADLRAAIDAGQDAVDQMR